MANLVLSAPSGTRSALVADTDPPAVLAPLAVGPSGTLRSLSTVRPDGVRQTVAALDRALQQLPPGPDDPRLVVLYTAAPDAGGPPAADLAARLTAAGAVLAVVAPEREVPPYWATAAAATGGTAVAARSGVIAAFDELAAALRTRYLVTFPRPEVLPVAAVVTADTPEGPVTADAVVPRLATAAGPTGVRGPGAILAAAAVGLLLLVGGVLGWGAIRRARRPARVAWNVPSRDGHAAPRDRLLAAMHAAVRDGGVAVLRPDGGTTGLGTTSAMIEFAHRWRGEYDIVWWVPAADPPLVADRLAELAETIGLAATIDSAEEATDRLLAALRRRDRWLLVLDDAGSHRQLARFLPGGPGHVLVASDDPSWDGHATPVAVGRFDRDESIAVLRVPPSGAVACPGGSGGVRAGRRAAGYRRRRRDARGDRDERGAYLQMPPSRPARRGCDGMRDRRGPARHRRPGRVEPAGDAGLPGPRPRPAVPARRSVHGRIHRTARRPGGGPAAARAGPRRRPRRAAAPDPGRGDRRARRERRPRRDRRPAAPGYGARRPASPTWRTLLPHVLAATDPTRRLDDVVLEVGWLLHPPGRTCGREGSRGRPAPLSRTPTTSTASGSARTTPTPSLPPARSPTTWMRSATTSTLVGCGRTRSNPTRPRPAESR